MAAFVELGRQGMMIIKTISVAGRRVNAEEEVTWQWAARYGPATKEGSFVIENGV